MARTVRLKVYQFSELSAAAKQNAMDWYLSGEDFSWIIEEAWESTQQFADIFDIKITSFDYEQVYRSEWRFDLEDQILELSGQRLATYIWNNYRSRIFKGKYYGKLVDTFPNGEKIPVSDKHRNGTRHVKRYSKCILETECVLTGVCYDYDLLQPIYDFLNKPDNRDFKDLLTDCLQAVAKSVRGEIEANRKEDAIADTMAANEYEFTANGERFVR